MKNKRLSAALLCGFDSSGACLALASSLHRAGMPVIAVCSDGEAVREAERLGCAAVQAEGEEGQAKAALELFLRDMAQLPGVVLVDLAGGYTADDVLAVADAMLEDPGKLAIASRNREKKPGLQRVERLVAQWAFAAVHGQRILDPWARLRGIPAGYCYDVLRTKGTERGFWFNMLLALHKNGQKVVNVLVETAYQREPGTHTIDRFKDIVRIVRLPLKYVSVSLSVLFLDNLLFYLFSYEILHGNRPVSIAIGRFSGALLGYLLNRSVVFKNKGIGWRKELTSVGKYTLLVAFNYCAALALNYLLGFLPIGLLAIKLLADVILYVTTFIVQRDVVFKKKKKPAIEPSPV